MSEQQSCFNEKLQPDKFHEFMLKETLKEKKEGYLKGYLTRIIRKNDAPPGKVPGSTSFETFTLRLVSKSFFCKIRHLK